MSYKEKWEYLKSWLQDCAKNASLYEAAKVYEYVGSKMKLIEDTKVVTNEK